MANLKIPPHSLESEQAIIGSVLLTPAVWQDVEHLRPDEFYIAVNRRIWELFWASEKHRDLFGLMDALEDPEHKVYAGELMRSNPGPAMAKVYAQTIHERYLSRRLISAASSILEDAWKLPATDAMSAAQRQLDSVSIVSAIGAGPRHVSEIGGDWYAEYKERVALRGKIVGLSTGFRDLDARWGGLRAGQMIVVAGRPGTGKSTLAANIAQYCARQVPVLVFNMEMSASEMIDRAMASEGPISLSGIRNGTLDDDHTRALVDVWAAFASAKLYIDDSAAQTVDSLRLTAKSFVNKHGRGLIVVDYLQLIRGDGTEYERVSEASRGMKLIAKETGCPVIALAQMNRQIEVGAREPVLADLKGSGSIEQDADVVCFTHHESEESGWCKIITRKIRSGVPGADCLSKQFDVARFRDTPEGWEPPEKEKPRNTRKGMT